MFTFIQFSFPLPEVPCWQHHGEGPHRRSPQQVGSPFSDQCGHNVCSNIIRWQFNSFVRENSSEPWGFRLSGGKDQGQPLQISQVGSKTEMIFNALYHFNWKLNSLWICCHVKHNHPGCEGQPDPEGRFAPKRLLDQRRRRRGLRDDPWPGWLFREAKKREDNGLRSHLEATNILQKLFSGRASDPEGGRQVHDGHWTVSGKSWKGKGFPMNWPRHAASENM